FQGDETHGRARCGPRRPDAVSCAGLRGRMGARASARWRDLKGLASMSRAMRTAGMAAALVAVGGGAYLLNEHARGPSVAERWALFDRYCLDCHNRDDYTADLAFETLSPES